jgi:hypothetical protein
MKPIWIAVAVLTATLALAGCKNRKEEPVPGPKSEWSATGRHEPRDHHGASGIAWFQGTLEEAFSPTCHKCASLFRH